MSEQEPTTSPVPGMDPFLEESELWPSFHYRFAIAIANQLNTLLGRRYYADVTAGTSSKGIGNTAVALPPAPIQRVVPDLGKAKLLAVHVYLSGLNQLVVSIEILSPYNKRPREGLEEYRWKRNRILHSTVHLIEIDLLRGGERPGAEVADPPLEADYVLVVNRFRGYDDRVAEIWPAALGEALPRIPVPLIAPDPDVPLDLNAAIATVYLEARYRERVNYAAAVPSPPLRALVEGRVAEILKQAT